MHGAIEMKNSESPAMPTIKHDVKCGLPLHTTESKGLTKREVFAMHAMQGMLASSPLFYPSRAVEYADELLKELGK